MFENVIDMIMLQYYLAYTENKEAIENDEDFDKSRERKKMNELVQAIVVLHQNKNNR